MGGPTGGTLHGIGLPLLQAMGGVPQSGAGDPGLLVPDASRQEAEANLTLGGKGGVLIGGGGLN